MPPAVTPRFSVVTAVNDAAGHLPEFMAAIDRQTFDLDQVEVIMVDDASTDASLRILEEWAAARPATVRVLRQPDAGQGARNTGLAAAGGEWVTFPDPHDIVDDNYLQTVHEFVEANPTADLVAAGAWLWQDETDRLVNQHPLETFFRYDRLVDLDDSNGRFHADARTAFFRLSTIREHELRYDERTRPNFEDGHFCSSYLLQRERPLVGFLGSTRYHRRQREDEGSSLGTSMTHPGRYTDVFTYGYTAILDLAVELRGEVPIWLQHLLCYEMADYFRAARANGISVVSQGPLAETLHTNVQSVLARVDPERTLRHTEFRLRPDARLAAMFGYRTTPWREPAVLLDKVDSGQRLVRARYRFTGDAPQEEVHNGDRPSVPMHAKTRDLSYFGRTLLRERVLWLRYEPDVRIRLDGEWVPLVYDDAFPPPSTKSTPQMVERQIVRHIRPAHNPTAFLPQTRRDRLYRRLAASSAVRKRYDDAWVLLDRIHNAGDSGEILFKHLRREHPDINAWFVVRDDSADFKRLKAEGYGDRLVAHGSVRWRLLMANCTNLLSSHADGPVTNPAEIEAFVEPRWRFTFLQHGVIKDDLSRWLGPKAIDLFVTSTVPEYDSIAGDHNAYPFTTKETILTGLPRFDRLVEIGNRFPIDQRDLVLLVPTWRHWLVKELSAGSQERALGGDVLESEFVREWMGVLSDARLSAACREAGVQLAFLPHPNLQSLLEHLQVPDHVRVLSYEGADVQEYFARARVMVTDYSSIAFNAAYLERPVVYFQFDADAVLTGAHVGERGYFDYGRDGFGPVATDRGGAVDAITEALEHGGPPLPEYQRRIEETFPTRDGGCSERVVQAVLDAGRPDTGR